MESIERVSIEQYNLEVDEAIARVKAGEFYTNEEAKQMLEEDKDID